MSSSVIKAISDSLEKEQAAFEKRTEQLIETAKRLNSGLPPTIDAKGQLHSPCAGYIWGELEYGKGEFLKVEGDYREARKESGRIKITGFDIDALSELAKKYGFGFSIGRFWAQGDIKVCYAYIVGLAKSTMTMIEEAIDGIEKNTNQNTKYTKGEAPIGRVQIKGTVKNIFDSLNSIPDGYTTDSHVKTLNMLVELDNKATVYCKIPKSIIDVQVGDLILFTATFKHAENNNTHSFGSRPAQDAEILYRAPREEAAAQPETPIANSEEGKPTHHVKDVRGLDAVKGIQFIIDGESLKEKSKECVYIALDLLCNAPDKAASDVARSLFQGNINILMSEELISDGDHAYLSELINMVHNSVKRTLRTCTKG